MSFLDLLKLLELSLILILTVNAKGQEWSVDVPSFINATLGATVTIQCTFNYPHEQQTDKVQLYWKVPISRAFDTKVEVKHAFIYHPIDAYVLKQYRTKTKLIGDKTMKNCSLMIKNIKDDINQLYLRVTGKNDSYSFVKNNVSIRVYGSLKPISDKYDFPLTTNTPEDSTMPTKLKISTLYISIFIPAVAVLIIITVVGIVCYRKRKRSESLTRGESGSGYYANISRASLSQVKRQDVSTNQDSKQVSHSKVIDDPVYINLQLPSCQTFQTANPVDNIYGNVDYSQ